MHQVEPTNRYLLSLYISTLCIIVCVKCITASVINRCLFFIVSDLFGPSNFLRASGSIKSATSWVDQTRVVPDLGTSEILATCAPKICAQTMSMSASILCIYLEKNQHDSTSWWMLKWYRLQFLSNCDLIPLDAAQPSWAKGCSGPFAVSMCGVALYTWKGLWTSTDNLKQYVSKQLFHLLQVPINTGTTI